MADETPDTQPDATPASAVAPLQSGDAVRLGDDAPSAASAPGKPLEGKGTGKVRVRTRYPTDRFDHDVKGVEPITASGVEVDRSKAKQLLEAAEAAGAELEEVIENA